MWIKDYSRRTILEEMNFHDHQTIDKWLYDFQLKMACWVDITLSKGLDSPFFKRLEESVDAMKKPAATQKKPAAAQKKPAAVKKKPAAVQQSRSAKRALRQLKRPAGKQKIRNHTLKKRVLIADESFLNKNKPGKLSKTGRPKPDQLWIWGAVLQGYSSSHFIFRILDHPSEAMEGKPRGNAEMMQNYKLLGLRKGDIFVSDSWTASISALKHTRTRLKLTEAQLKHELVNHSKGEIVNERGYTTNPIEGKWSVLKRWVKRKYGGKLPNHTNRCQWRLLVNEFQGRGMLATSSFDYGNFTSVPVKAAVKAYVV